MGGKGGILCKRELLRGQVRTSIRKSHLSVGNDHEDTRRVKSGPVYGPDFLSAGIVGRTLGAITRLVRTTSKTLESYVSDIYRLDGGGQYLKK